MSNYEMVKEWIKRDICPYGRMSDFIEEKDLDTKDRHRFRIYTESYKYSVDVVESTEERPAGYLGCVVSTRKPRPGEDWTRGNDLPDGECSEKTWNSIKNAIVRYELVKLSKPVTHMADENNSTLGPSLPPAKIKEIPEPEEVTENIPVMPWE